MIYLGRRVPDCIKVLQDKTLAVICPLANNSPLKRDKYVSANNIFRTHCNIPSLDIINAMDTDIKSVHDNEDLNPK